jgi:hypothetical protein
MKIGDKVKLVKGNPVGKVGRIACTFPVAGPVDLIDNPRGLDSAKPTMHFSIESDDGTEFSAADDQLESVD